MITRVKDVLTGLCFVLLTVAVAGATYVAAAPRRIPDAPLAVDVLQTVTPSPSRLGPSSPSPDPVSRLPAVPTDGALDPSGSSSATTAAPPTPIPVVSDGVRQKTWSETEIDVLERELRDLTLRARLAQRATQGHRLEPTSTPQAEGRTGSIFQPGGGLSMEAIHVPTVPPAAPVPVPAAPSEVGEGRWIDVDLAQQLLTAYEGRSPVHSTLVSSGLPGTPTPVGQFRVWVKFRYDDMEGPGYYLPDVPYTMYFHGGYGLHGTYWHSNFGHPMSHGCVNLPTEEAEWLFHWAEVGTLVNVHN